MHYSSLFTPISFNLHGMLNIAAAVFNFTVGLIVLLNNPRSKVQRSFFYFTTSCWIWVGGYGLLSLAANESTSYFWFSMSYFGVCTIPPTLFQFSRRLLGTSRFEGMTVVGYLVGIAFACVMGLSRNKLCAISVHSWGKYNRFLDGPISDSFFICLMAFFLIFISSAYFNFLIGYRRAGSPTEKRQFRNILFGFSIGYFGMLDFAVTKGFPMYPIGYLALTFLIGTIWYSIARYQLWDINFIIKRFSLFTLLYVFLLGFIVPVAFYFARPLFHDRSPGFIMMFVVFSTLFGAVLSLGPLLYALIVRHSFWMKSHVTAGMTHELKSPISAIQSSVEILQERLAEAGSDSELSVCAKPYVDMVQKNSERLARFVNDLLLVANIQDGSITISREKLDLARMIEEVIEQYRPIAIEKKINVVTEFVREPCEWSGDAEKLRQAFSNVLGNAIKYSEKSIIRIQLSKRSEVVLIRVIDQGKGISARDLPRVFERFYSGNHSGRGAGLGLAIAKAWVEAHDGRIWAESEGEGKGTILTFTLPPR